MTDTSDTGRLSGLVAEVQAKIEEIKGVMRPAFESLAADARAKAEELGTAIDDKLQELKDAVDQRRQ